ncbi:hypothetical protein Pmani_018676 [Petrolisthes manimaculis]|uniref:Uncharacterized protein n=1 Tax=Petrolisthes manimaculis TaxID=1843537 RepID=A0AAE1U4A7_9EUCA|nr:hypothetical protein Pmani_018676 [Petrolisthes manimaculis]
MNDGRKQVDGKQLRPEQGGRKATSVYITPPCHPPPLPSLSVCLRPTGPKSGSMASQHREPRPLPNDNNSDNEVTYYHLT